MGKQAPPPPAAGRLERRPTASLRAHPATALLPRLARKEEAALLSDFQARGIQVPLDVTEDGVVLDGHLRLQAAQALGIAQLPVRVVEVADPAEFIVLAAIARRHLSGGQRAALLLELERHDHETAQARARSLANLKGQPAEVADLPARGRTRDRLAALADTSPRTVQNVATVKNADPELFEQIKQGKIKADRAARRVLQRQRDASLPDPGPLPGGLFDLTYADPAWRLPGSPDTSRAVENHYPTMQLAQICELQIPAADNAILFLWAVNSLLPEALEVLDTWGFRYRTNFAWAKDRIGLGAFVRTQHELLLVATKGNYPPPAEERRPSSLIRAPRGRHSAKPDQVYELLERMYPAASKLELFARGEPRPGWQTWGNQAEPVDNPNG